MAFLQDPAGTFVRNRHNNTKYFECTLIQDNIARVTLAAPPGK